MKNLMRSGRLTRPVLQQLEADLRDVFGLYDLELVSIDAKEGLIKVVPFSAHKPLPKDTRGAKKGQKKAWGGKTKIVETQKADPDEEPACSEDSVFKF